MNKAAKHHAKVRVTLDCPHCGARITHPSRTKYYAPSYPERALHRRMFCIVWIPTPPATHSLRSSWLTSEETTNQLYLYVTFRQRNAGSFDSYKIETRRCVPIPLP